MPANYTPTATNHATITVPVDGDQRNAASVSTGLEQLADNIALTRADYLPLAGGTMSGSIVLSGGSAQIDDENGTATPGLISNVQAASGHKKNLVQWATGPSVAGNGPVVAMYGSAGGTDGQFEITHNAGWDDVAQKWNYIDPTHATAVRLIMQAGGGIISQKYAGSNTWADNAWVTQATMGGANACLEADATSANIGITVAASSAHPGMLVTSAAAGDALSATTSSSGRAVHGATSGTGSAGLFTTSGAGDALDATSTGAGSALSVSATSTGDAIDVVSTNAGAGISVVASGAGGGVGIDASSGSGLALIVTGNGSHAAISAVAGNGQAAVHGSAPGGGGAGVVGATTNGDPGVSGTSNNSGAAVAGSSSGSGPAVNGTATGSCLSAVMGDASGGVGYGAQLQGNATRAPLHLAPRSALPTTPSLGDLAVVNLAGVAQLWFYTSVGGTSGWVQLA